MNFGSEKTRSLHLDGKVLARYLYSLNIVRHHSELYPESHPLVVRSLQQVIVLLAQLLEFEENLQLGVARDTLLVGPDILDRRNAVYRDLAAALFACDIASVTFYRSLSDRELWQFLQGLRLKREGLEEHGGIRQFLNARGVRHMEATPIDYRAFRTTEEASLRSPPKKEASDALWVSFIEGLMQGTLDPQGKAPLAGTDPELLASWLNQTSGTGISGEEEDRGDERYERTITSFLQQIDREDIDSSLRKETLEKLNAFFGRLAPDVRRKFLSSTFRFLDGRRHLAQEMVGAFSDETILGILAEIEEDTISVPPLVIELLGQFSTHAAPVEQRRVVVSRELAQEELKKRILTLFREDCSERFVTLEYQQFLQKILAARPTGVLDPAGASRLAKTMESHSLEKQICSVILHIDRDLCEGESEELRTNLADLITFFLREGNVNALLETHDRLTAQAEEPNGGSLLARGGLALYSQPEFIEEVWRSLDGWGKNRLPDIQALIGRVGAPFAESLLDRLAEESSMSMRRFYMDCLVRLRQGAIAPVVARLRDRRWYFVRNLVIVLRRLEDPRVLEPVGRMMAYPHAKVQMEVIKTFQQFNDPRADRYLLRELDHPDAERRLRAVQSARWSFTGEVLQRLGEMLLDDFADEAYPLKSALVRTLAEIGDPAAVAILGRFLSKRFLRHRLVARRLKAEIIRALGQNPSEEGQALLNEFALGNGELAPLAAQALKSFPGTSP